MNRLILFLILAINSASTVFSQKQMSQKIPETWNEQNLSDSVKNLIPRILNNDMPGYRDMFPEGWTTHNGRCLGFTIYNLVDTLDNSYTLESDFRIKRKSIYHICPIESTWAVSYILIMTWDSLRVFKGLNCVSKGASIQDVIKYSKVKFPTLFRQKERIEIIRNYRKFSNVVRTDNFSALNCSLFSPSRF